MKVVGGETILVDAISVVASDKGSVPLLFLRLSFSKSRRNMLVFDSWVAGMLGEEVKSESVDVIAIMVLTQTKGF